MSETVTTELREHRRLAPTIIRADVEYDGKRRQAYLMNVSLGGAFLSVDDPPSPESPLAIHILLPWGLGECRLDARAVWVQVDERERPIGAGISFVSVPDDAKAKLKGYLERFEELSGEITR